ncbi:hypothetical protein RB195_003639 [Necator americanus]|uniref:Uncharacterized protein n=1 Tax=Necator americanus TaxID=51031 RepID=A0ABR1DPH4_NECAM
MVARSTPDRKVGRSIRSVVRSFALGSKTTYLFDLESNSGTIAPRRSFTTEKVLLGEWSQVRLQIYSSSSARGQVFGRVKTPDHFAGINAQTFDLESNDFLDHCAMVAFDSRSKGWAFDPLSGQESHSAENYIFHHYSSIN